MSVDESVCVLGGGGFWAVNGVLGNGGIRQWVLIVQENFAICVGGVKVFVAKIGAFLSVDLILSVVWSVLIVSYVC